MSVVVTCRRCGFDFEVDRTMLIRGDWQRACPVCHPGQSNTAIPVAQFTVGPLPHRVFRHYGHRVAWIALTGCSAACTFCTSGAIALHPERLSSVAGSGGDVSDPDLTWRHMTVEQTPAALVRRAERQHCAGLYFSFSEPMVHPDFLTRAARLAAERGMWTVIDTNGLSTPDDIARVTPHIAACYVGIKGSLSPAFYQRRMRVAPETVETVKRAILAWRDAGIELAISDVVEPPCWQPADALASATLRDCYAWLAEYVGPDTPLDVRPMFRPATMPPTRLLPRYATPADIAAFDRRYALAREIARACGLTLGDDYRRLWRAAA